MSKIVMYKTAYCGYCTAALRFLTEVKKQQVEVIDLTHKPKERMELIKTTGRRTVPQIFIGDFHVGGYDDLRRLDNQGELDHLLDALK